MQTRAPEFRPTGHVVYVEESPELISVVDDEEALLVEAEAPLGDGGGLQQTEYHSGPFRIWRGAWQLLKPMGGYLPKTFDVVKFRLCGDMIKYARCLVENNVNPGEPKHTCKIDLYSSFY
jgi:hypothetical protein